MEDVILIIGPNVNVITWNALRLECQKRKTAELKISLRAPVFSLNPRGC